MVGTAKEKIVGILLLIIGAFPLIMMIESVQTSLSQYEFLSYLIPGEPAILYQVIIILLGIMLFWSNKPRPVGR